MIRRIFGWLAAEPHDDIFTMCLTQPVKKGETLRICRARMRRKETEYLQTLKDRGLLAGASCTHIVWSQACGGWHYHVHLLLELPRGEWSPEALRELYSEIGAAEKCQAGEDSSRLVVSAGPAAPELVEGGGDPDFWSEHAGGVAAAVQYPVRDMAQGIGATRCGGDRERVAECVAVLLKHAKGWKLRRTVGKWRKPPPALQLNEGELEVLAESKASAAPSIMETRFGTVHRLSRQAVAGDQFAAGLFGMLEASIRNNTEFAKRFVVFCRSAVTYVGRKECS